MNIHEYQAKEIFQRFGLPIPAWEMVTTADDAVAAAGRIGLPAVVKAQVLTGGRGKAGGVKLAKSEAEVRKHAEKILGLDIKGHIVRRLLLTAAKDIAEEYYVAILIDRNSKKPLLMASAEGGVEIEQVAKDNPGAILRRTIDSRYGLLDHQALGLGLELCKGDIKKARQIGRAMQKLYAAFMHADASLAEINPWIFTPEGEGWALDAKVNLDDNAMFRHADYEPLRDLDEENPAERRAREAGLSFVKLDGNIGCLVNGAGLAMATMDLVQYHGGVPANFLDIGGSSNPDKVVAALQIILDDPNVKAILFNIFGGITRCDDVAAGIIAATERMKIEVPIVVRLIGTNEAEARRMLAETSLTAAATMDEAVQKAIALAV